MAKNTSGPKPDDKAPEGKAAPDGGKPSEGNAAAAKIAVTVRTKTGNPYRRLGRVWIRDWTSAEVTADERSVLESDPWLEVRE